MEAIAQPTKTGQLFVLDRFTGAPIHPINEVPVPPSDIPGEITSKTQPFTKPELIYGKLTIDENSLNQMDSFENKSIKDSIQKMIYGQLYLPPAENPPWYSPNLMEERTGEVQLMTPTKDPSMSIQAMNLNGSRCLTCWKTKKYLPTIMENNSSNQIVIFVTTPPKIIY